jgi:hypothetical protein
MGMTLWIDTLEDRNYSRDSDDHSLMHAFSEKLDGLCEIAGMQKLSDFFDFTGLEYDYDDADSDDDDEPDVDPETELAYGIDDMSWFDASEGLATLTMLHDRVNAGALDGLSADQRGGLLEELADCILVLQGPASRSGKFHLSVVE